MDNSFKFLKGVKMIHPTTGITLEYLDKSNSLDLDQIVKCWR